MLDPQKTRPARLLYMANGFRVLTPGDYVRCAGTQVAIPLDELRYWCPERQEAYADAVAATKVLAEGA